MTHEEKELPKATHSGTVKIGKLELKVHKLDNGKSIIEKESMERFFEALENGTLLEAVSDEELRDFAKGIKGIF